MHRSVVVRHANIAALAGALMFTLTSPASARPRKPVPPVDRTPAVPTEVLAPDTDTIPADLDVPSASTPEASATSDAPASNASASDTPASDAPASGGGDAPASGRANKATVEGDDTTYVIDTSSSEAIDEDVLADQAEREDPRVLARNGRRFLAAGAPLLAVGAAAMIGGALLGQFEADTEIGAQAWVPLMVGGVLLAGAGIPLTVRGVLLRRDARAGFEEEARETARLVPAVQRTRTGTWTGGFAARF